MHEIHTPYGRAYEDFRVGELIRHWPGRTVTQSDNHLFSLLTLNQHPLHSDAHYASGTSFGKNIINGVLVFSLGVGMTTNDISGAAIAHLGYEKILHLKPVFPGDTLYARSAILGETESKSKMDRGIVHVETTVSNQAGEDILSFYGKLLIPMKKFAQRPHTHQLQSL